MTIYIFVKKIKIVSNFKLLKSEYRIVIYEKKKQFYLTM